ncbi:MAG: multidrug efflux pump subunit AcrA (membrane-fusion protein), partial [Verrucomicrobiales bacterium]
LANQQLLALQGAGSNNALAQRKVEVELNLRMLNLERTSLVARKDGLDDLVKEREEILAEMRSGQTAEDPVNTDLWDAEDKKQLEIMELRGERTILRSQRKGRIDRIVKEPGEYVKAGESIVKVVAEATQILGFLPQQEVSSVNVGDEVWVTSAVDRVTTYKSTITSLSPRIDSVRDAASPLPNQAVRGRTILIDFPTESGFLPGQPVIIHLQPPGELSLIRKFFRMLGIGK